MPVYKDNAFNGKLGRVGEPHGSCILKCEAKKEPIKKVKKAPFKKVKKRPSEMSVKQKKTATPPKPPPQKKKSTPQKKERKRWWEYKLEFWRDKDAHDRMTDKGWKLIHNDGFKLYYRKYGTPSEIRDDTEGHHNQPKLVRAGSYV